MSKSDSEEAAEPGLYQVNLDGQESSMAHDCPHTIDGDFYHFVPELGDSVHVDIDLIKDPGIGTPYVVRLDGPLGWDREVFLEDGPFDSEVDQPSGIWPDTEGPILHASTSQTNYDGAC